MKAKLLTLLVLLTGCERSVYDDWTSARTAETADIADVNARNALAQVSSLKAKVVELEQQNEALRREVQDLERRNELIMESLSSFQRTYNSHTH